MICSLFYSFFYYYICLLLITKLFIMNIYLSLVVMTLGRYLAKHGKTKKVEKYHFGKQIIYTAITLWLLYMAGLPIKF